VHARESDAQIRLSPSAAVEDVSSIASDPSAQGSLPLRCPVHDARGQAVSQVPSAGHCSQAQSKDARATSSPSPGTHSGSTRGRWLRLRVPKLGTGEAGPGRSASRLPPRAGTSSAPARAFLAVGEGVEFLRDFQEPSAGVGISYCLSLPPDEIRLLPVLLRSGLGCCNIVSHSLLTGNWGARLPEPSAPLQRAFLPALREHGRGRTGG
jgi:hypothetical protein